MTQRSAWAAFASVVVVAVVSLASRHADARPGESSFTPTSLRVPLHGIRLESGADPSASASLYACPSPDPSACLVDMADDGALAALFDGGAEVAPGTYDRIRIHVCAPGASGYEALVRGKVALLDQSWVTTSSPGDVLTTDASRLGDVRVPYSGCSTDVPLPGPLVVKKGDAITLSAFFSLRDIAWATLTSNGPPGGCAFGASGQHNVCTAYPIPVVYVGAASPVLDTYWITEDLADVGASKAGGQVLLLRDGDGEPFGGFTRRMYSALSESPSVNYDTPVKSIARHASDPTYAIENWGGGSPSGAPLAFYVRFPAFALASHAGILERGDGSGTVPYRAVKQE